MEWPAYLDEYEKLVFRMTTPRVMIDNAGCSNSTRVMIDSARKHGILLEAVQVLTDLNLSIKKAYISSDGRWFMDGERNLWKHIPLFAEVRLLLKCAPHHCARYADHLFFSRNKYQGALFHVTDLDGNKLTDESVISYIEQSLGTIHFASAKCFDGLTALELTGTDRIGLLSEVFAVLSELQCNIVEANVWTHNGRIASLIYVKEGDSGSPIEDSQKIDTIEARLRNVLKGDNDIRSAKTSVSMAVTHTERRLHQMMFADRDYERKPVIRTNDNPIVSVLNCLEKGYSVINVQCKDRPNLLFDVVCTLTDMQYVVFHATVNTAGDRAYLEFFIRHTDGSPISSEAEKQRVILCLRAAIERRASEGVRLELCTGDKQGLLAEVTRTFRENGLNVTRAEISTISDNTALNVFYVTDANGNPADPKIIDSVRQKIGLSDLKVKELPLIYHQKGEEREEPTGGAGGAMLLSLGSIVRKNLYNLGLIKSYS